MLVTAMDHSHQQRRLSMGLMNNHHADVDPEYLDLANHTMHAPSYQLQLQHSHSLDLTHSHYLDDGLQDEHYTINGQVISPKNNAKPSLYKTELCKRFSEYGSCRYGAKCQFAHGLPELRHVLRHPKYKTTKCKSYWGSGHCPYGSRCRFIHEEEVYNPNVKNSFRGGLTQENELSPTGQNGSSFLNSQYAPEFSPTSAEMGPGIYSPDFNSLRGPGSPQSWLGAEGGRTNFMRSNSDMYPTKTNPIGPKRSPLASSPHNDLDNGLEYSGLQDAIEVLMKFSTEADPSTSTSPKGVVSSASSIKSPLARSDISLQADELWKDFNAVSIADTTSDAPVSGSATPSSEWFMGNDSAPQYDSTGNEIREDNSRLSFFTKFK
ncbi:hypothetical protein LEN26_013075 [Aphanomyces euteiches]|nr:hypothetical protein AeMF1_018550 [Aphanomyces euteiches]KAH9113833.1 hypothetical protein LEN26_013075 [Aphanomyces euteiches]KAH9191910.1 hypothetical protein AeNC1_006118 [Aphanomyces euteiches]